jgi:uncharacterized membrane protein HdeD (DUF308 family)
MKSAWWFFFLNGVLGANGVLDRLSPSDRTFILPLWLAITMIAVGAAGCAMVYWQGRRLPRAD